MKNIKVIEVTKYTATAELFNIAFAVLETLNLGEVNLTEADEYSIFEIELKEDIGLEEARLLLESYGYEFFHSGVY